LRKEITMGKISWMITAKLFISTNSEPSTNLMLFMKALMLLQDVDLRINTQWWLA
jgi:hypothetical protein